MGFEDRAVLVAEFLRHGISIAGDFPSRGFNRLFEPLQFIVHRIARHEPTGNAKSLVVHHQRFADGYAGRNGNPLEFLHWLSMS